MKRIRFVVTGDLERKAIASSISAQFPAVANDGAPVEWLRPQMTPAATTHRLIASQPPSGPMRALARKVLAEVAEFEDIADFFGVTSPLGPLPTPSLTYPGRRVDRAQLLLRNG